MREIEGQVQKEDQEGMERRGGSERWARKKSHLQSRSGDFEMQVLGRVGNRGQAKSWRADGPQGVSGIIAVVASPFLWVAGQGAMLYQSLLSPLMVMAALSSWVTTLARGLVGQA